MDALKITMDEHMQSKEMLNSFKVKKIFSIVFKGYKKNQLLVLAKYSTGD